jgi:hypothetical protein
VDSRNRSVQLNFDTFGLDTCASRNEKLLLDMSCLPDKKHLNSLLRAPLKLIIVGQPWIIIEIYVSGLLVRTPRGNTLKKQKRNKR